MVLHGTDTRESCVHYWTPTEDELNELGLQTYEPIEHAMADSILGLIKKGIPNYCNVPSEFPHVIAKQERYFAVSNREDLIVLELERKAFEVYYLETKKEIRKSLVVKK